MPQFYSLFKKYFYFFKSYNLLFSLNNVNKGWRVILQNLKEDRYFYGGFYII